MKLAIVLLLSAVVATAAGAEAAAGAARDLIGVLLQIIGRANQKRSVGVSNEADGQIRLWCASKDDRIKRDGNEYIDVEPGNGIGWGFTPNVLNGFSGDTLFWCTFCYNNERRGFDVYDQGWEGDKAKVPENGVLVWKMYADKAVLNDDATTHLYQDLKLQGDC